MQNYRDIFCGKKVTIMGLGLLGGALNDAIFLAECGAELTITDLKTEVELASSLKKLRSTIYNLQSTKFVLGRHDLADFQKADFILQPGNVPPNSPYLLEAQKNNIPIHESESLFFVNLPAGVKTVGVTGTRGKTTTTRLIFNILKSVHGRKVHLAGNTQGKSTLALLKVIKPRDIVVLELDSWCLHGMGEVKKSPNVAVFTNLMPDHLNFYLKTVDDQTSPKLRWARAMQKYFLGKSQIYLNQTKDDFLICGEKIAKKIGKTKSQKIIVGKKDIPKNWKLKIPGEHNLVNIACAISVARALKIEEKIIKKTVENFGGVEGRLEFIKSHRGIKIYNDTTATTPEATLAALKALSSSVYGLESTIYKRIILIFGGADKGLDMSGLIKEIPKYCREIFLLAGTGSEKLVANSYQLKALKINKCPNLKSAIEGAMKNAKKGDTVLFSPAFASFGMFKNEYDRGDKFNKLIKSLK